VLLQRGDPPRARWLLRARGRGAADPTPPAGDTVRAFLATPTRLGFDELDVARQSGVSHHYFLGDRRAETFSVPYRYAWPAELDLMARIAGLHLRERWAGWRREPFTSDSTAHVSVWEKPASSPSGGGLVRTGLVHQEV
jgi:hypothetical protein